MYPITKLCKHFIMFLQYLETIRRSFLDFLFCLPTSLFALLLILLLVYNSFSVFYVPIPSPAKFSPEKVTYLPEILTGESVSPSHSSTSSTTTPKVPPLVMYAMKEDNPPKFSKPVDFSRTPIKTPLMIKPRKARKQKALSKRLGFGEKTKGFGSKMKLLENSSCKFKFFMTWISSLDSFSDRELFSIESVFKSHPNNSCLVIVSNSFDSKQGRSILRPFIKKGFQVITTKPDFDYIFKNTYAEIWFNKLKIGKIDPGLIPIEQNLSNLLRLVLLYKFGGIYIDTDVIVLKSFAGLRNVIGAQAIDAETKKWSRLNNAVLIFDKKHPLLYKFIEEFALTFNGNKWGHNGPYLASRVVDRISERRGFNFTVLPPSAFYPVDWNRIQSLFRAPRNETHSRWLRTKLARIKRESFAVHLWNRQSRGLRIEEGSIIHNLKMSGTCILCSSTSL